MSIMTLELAIITFLSASSHNDSTRLCVKEVLDHVHKALTVTGVDPHLGCYPQHALEHWLRIERLFTRESLAIRFVCSHNGSRKLDTYIPAYIIVSQSHARTHKQAHARTRTHIKRSIKCHVKCVQVT